MTVLDRRTMLMAGVRAAAAVLLVAGRASARHNMRVEQSLGTFHLCRPERRWRVQVFPSSYQQVTRLRCGAGSSILRGIAAHIGARSM
jgi:hypothetical protein